MKRWSLVLALVLAVGLHPFAQDADPKPDPREAIERGISLLVDTQGRDGSWGRRSVFGGDKNIRASITLFCIRALEKARKPDKKVRSAIEQGRKFVLDHASDIPTRPSYQMYDFSFYSGAYGLQYFSRLARREKKHAPELKKLLKTIQENQRSNGGFSYTWRSRYEDTYEGFCSAIVVLALLEAKKHGMEIPEQLYDRTLTSVEKARLKGGFFGYHIVSGKGRGSYSGNGSLDREGCLVRTVVCELALLRAGKGKTKLLKRAVDDFFKHREELEKVRKKDRKTHQGDFDNAPYFFFVGHYYTALALDHLSPDIRDAGHKALTKILFDIREDDGGWYESRITGAAYATAMGVLILDKITVREY